MVSLYVEVYLCYWWCCQFHPEFVSRPSRPHPLFRDFIGVAKDVLREGAQRSPPLLT
ncbi:hypothetical protein ACFLUJ_06710 [Chloroflexota bacterium]